MKVLFVLEKFYPDSSANLNCLSPIFNELLERNFKVDVLTYRQNIEYKKCEVVNNISVIRVDDNYNMSKNDLLKKFFWRLYRKLFLNKKMISTGKKLLLHNKYDVVIACSYPFLMEEIASKIVNGSSVPFISYQLDPFYCNSNLPINEKNQRLKHEINILSRAKKIFLPIENYYENIETGLAILKDKYYPIDYPLIIKKNFNVIKNEKPVFVYTGTLYNNIRNPKYVLEFFSKLNFDFKLIMCYISDDIVEKDLNYYKSIMNDKLILKRNQTKEQCDRELENSSIIVNIGNSIANQTPSKIFEYISYCRPIVNFYSIENDTSKKILERYPLIFNVFKNFHSKDISEFEKFAKLNFNKIISFEEATSKYKISSVVAKEFVEEVIKSSEN